MELGGLGMSYDEYREKLHKLIDKLNMEQLKKLYCLVCGIFGKIF